MMQTITTGSVGCLCPHCGMGHSGTCPRIKAIEYHQDGTIKRVEFHAAAPMESIPSTSPLWPPQTTTNPYPLTT